MFPITTQSKAQKNSNPDPQKKKIPSLRRSFRERAAGIVSVFGYKCQGFRCLISEWRDFILEATIFFTFCSPKNSVWRAWKLTDYEPFTIAILMNYWSITRKRFIKRSRPKTHYSCKQKCRGWTESHPATVLFLQAPHSLTGSNWRSFMPPKNPEEFLLVGPLQLGPFDLHKAKWLQRLDHSPAEFFVGANDWGGRSTAQTASRMGTNRLLGVDGKWEWPTARCVPTFFWNPKSTFKAQAPPIIDIIAIPHKSTCRFCAHFVPECVPECGCVVEKLSTKEVFGAVGLLT